MDDDVGRTLVRRMRVKEAFDVPLPSPKPRNAGLRRYPLPSPAARLRG